MLPRAALIAVSCSLLVACGGSGGDASRADSVPGGGRTLEQLWRDDGEGVAVVPGTRHHAPGRVRVSFLVVDVSGRPVILPTARVWVARGLDAQPYLETQAKLERIGLPGEDEADSTHIYVAHFRAPRPGTYWYLAEPEGGDEAVRALGQISVAPDDPVPDVGERAPASETPTLASVDGDASKLSTRVPPDLSLLRHSIAGSLRARVPFVVTFATPKFCASRVCGPVVDVVEEVGTRFRGTKVRFIHLEVYERNDPARGYNRWMREWRLDTEPWTFVVDRRGRIAARFEGTVSAQELEQAVRAVSD